MTSATMAVVALADPLDEQDVAQLHSQPAAVLLGGAVLAFATPSAAAQTLRELRIRRPFLRAALDVTEVDLDTSGTSALEGLDAVTRALRWAPAARPGELLLSDVARPHRTSHPPASRVHRRILRRPPTRHRCKGRGRGAI